MYAPLTLPWLRYERGDATTPTCMILLLLLLQVHYHHTMGPNPFKKSHNNWILHLFQFHQIYWLFFFKCWSQILSKRATIIDFYISLNIDSSSSSTGAKSFQKRATIVEFYTSLNFTRYFDSSSFKYTTLVQIFLISNMANLETISREMKELL